MKVPHPSVPGKFIESNPAPGASKTEWRNACRYWKQEHQRSEEAIGDILDDKRKKKTMTIWLQGIYTMIPFPIKRRRRF